MTQFPETRNSLLMQVKDQRNAEAWEQFVQIYRPVIYRLARQKDLQDADAQDLTQQVLIAVASRVVHWKMGKREPINSISTLASKSGEERDYQCFDSTPQRSSDRWFRDHDFDERTVGVRSRN